MKLIDRLFDDACSAIRNKKLTIDSWIRRTGLSKGTINSILDNKKVDRSSPTQISAINAIFDNEDMLLYHLLSKKIEMEEHELMGIRPYLGLSRYVGRNSDGSLVSGTVNIHDREGFFIFEHHPDMGTRDVDGDMRNGQPGPLHAGFVMRLGLRMYFIGLGSRYIRSLITYNTETPKTNVSSGLVLTSDIKNKRPMSGALFMAHESYRDFENFEKIYKSNFEAKLDHEHVGIIRN